MDRALKERIIGAIVLVAIVVLVVPVFLDGPAPADDEIISQPVLLPGQTREPGERRTVVLQRDREQPLPGGSARDAMHPVDAAAAGSARPVPMSAESEESPGAGEGAAVGDTAAGGDSSATAADGDGAAVSGTAAAEDAASAGDDASGTVADATAPDPREPSGDEQPAEAPAQTAPEAEPAGAESATGMWAVQIGSFSNKANADRLAARLREEGYAAFLSQHQGASGELHRVRIGPQEDRPSAEAVAARLSDDGFKGQVVPHP